MEKIEKTGNVKKDFDVDKIDKYIEYSIEKKLNSLLETLPDRTPSNLQIKPIYEFTIGELYKNTLQSSIDIIDDLSNLYSRKENINYDIFFNIFLKDNRKIYVGIILIILSFILYFIDGASV
jgi:hypothetical protein